MGEPVHAARNGSAFYTPMLAYLRTHDTTSNNLVRDPAAQAADVPVLEDVAFVRAVRRATAISRLPSPVVVSARRWETEGPYRTWLRNSALLIAYLLGVSPHRLAKWYPRQNA